MERRITVNLFTLILLVGLVLFHVDLFDTTLANMSVQSGSGGNAEAMPALQGQSAVDYLKQKGLLDQVKAAVEASRYEIKWQTVRGVDGFGGAHQADNHGQNLRSFFTRDGLEIVPSDESTQQSWKMGLKLRGIGYGELLSEIPTGPPRVSGNRIEIPHSWVTEWYVNKPEGIEQGFTVAERPRATVGDQPLRVVLELSGGLRARLQGDGQAVILERSDGKQVVRYDHLASFDGLGRSLQTRMELVEGGISLLIDDSSAAYPLTIDPLFTEVKKLTSSGSHDFGFVAISGDTIVVGAPFDIPGGAAYVYERNQGGADNWGQVKKLTAPNAAVFDSFGASVAISGDTIVVGDHGSVAAINMSEGSAYVFERNQGGAENWGHVKKLTPPDGVPHGFFGYSVGISGDTIVVGMNLVGLFGGAYDGSAYVYERNQGGAENWGQVKKLTASDGAVIDKANTFGDSVGISGNTIVVGAPVDASAYVYERNQGGSDNWGEVKKLTPSDGTGGLGGIGDGFGVSVAISDDTIVVGAFGDDSFKGAVYIYVRNHGGVGNWGELRKLTASDGTGGIPLGNGDDFGLSVRISGDTIVVGAHGDESDKGSAYVYERNHGGADNWGEMQKLTASDGASNDFFGLSVGISGDTIVVGAPRDESGTGSAYLFAPNSPPSITAAPVSRSPGDALANSTIANVSDPDQPANTLMVSVNGGASATVNGVSVSNITVDAMGLVKADVVAACGASNANFNLEVTDSVGETASDTLSVMVSDTTPPTLTLKPSIQLWPPNHKYVTVTMSEMVASVSDVCNTGVTINDVRIQAVTTDEPDNGKGDGNTTIDIVIAANCQSVQLRSERDGAKNGRVYSITLRVSDAAGNTTVKVFKVSVPKSHNGVPAVEDAIAQTVMSSCP